jgi:nucleoid-associated protein YgaU
MAEMTDAQMEKLKTSNTVVREILGAKLAIQNLKAEFDGGTVVLRGTAADQSARQQAVAIAGRVPGVTRVDDQMQTSGSAGAGAAASGARTYTVKKGDTLSAIAERELGAASKWKEIFEANRAIVKDPDKIMPGQVLTLPRS